VSILAWRGGGRVRGRGSGLIEGAHKPRPDLESICEALLRPSSQPTTSSRSFWPGKCQTCTLEACVLIRGRPCAGGRVCEGWVKVDASKVPSTPRVKI